MELSDDVWNVIFSYLDVKARANIASVNKRLSSLFSTWIDITMLSIKQDTLCIAGEIFKCITKCDLKVYALILQHCPNLNNVNIQTIRDESYLGQLSEIEHLNVLTVASSAFNSLSFSCLNTLCMKKLRKLCILQRYDELKTIQNILRQNQLTQIISAPLVSIQLSGIVLTPDIFNKLCNALKQTLTELLISGALCNPPDFDQYITSIGTLIHLKILDIPPSLFSCCHRTLPQKMFILKTLNLKKISVYVHYYSASNIAQFLSTMPKTLEELVIFRTTELDQITWSKDFEKLPYKVYLCRLDDVIFEPSWMCDRNELLSHTLWLPPYNHLHNFSRLDIPAEWYQDVFSTIREMNNQEAVTAQSNSVSTSRSEFVNLSPSNEGATVTSSISAHTVQSFVEDSQG
uniref:F-box domain-containing protein n=2 Tax=Wuchereria bancrofti TaxID=6293 RepID=A0AAF5PNF0_WUCBA